MKWSIGALMTARTAGIDPDAQALIDAAGITDATTISKVNRIIVNAKAHGWWYRCLAIYLFAGGTSTTCKFNAKDPRDLDAAFRVTFNGGWSFASTGITSDGGVATYAQTHLVPSTAGIGLNDAHISIYSRTSTAGSSTSSDIGATNSGTQDFRLILRRSTNAYLSIIHGSATTVTGTLTDASGFFLGTRASSTSHIFYRNGSVVNSNSSSNTNTVPSFEVYIGCTNFAGTLNGPTAREYAFASMGSSISAAMQALMNSDVQEYIS